VSEAEKSYESDILKIVANKYLDEATSVTQESLKSLEANPENYVWNLATKIYSQSGHKIELFMARDIVNSRIEFIKYKLDQEKVRIAEEKSHQATIEARRIAEGKACQAAREARRIAEDAMHSSADVNCLCESKAIVFTKVQQIIGDVLGIDKNEVTLETRLPPCEEHDWFFGAMMPGTGFKLVFDLEEEFDIEIPDEAAEEMTTVQDAVDYIAIRVIPI
jgi:acyl carrier protein